MIAQTRLHGSRVAHAIVAAVLLGLLVPHLAGATEGTVMVPDWELESAQGEAISYHADTAGMPSVLIFWATWCPYCRALLPHLEALREHYAERGVKFFALNIMEDGDPRAYFEQHGYGLTLVLAADLVGEDYAVEGTPSVFVADRQHRLVYRRQRGDDAAAVERALRAALDRALLAEAP